MSRPDRDAAARRQVGLLLEEPAAFATGMFGAWAAGLGVLPLPVEFPDARLREMLADCQPRLVLASTGTADRARRLVSGLTESPVVVVLDECTDRGAAGPADPPPVDAPAYTVYTSGSTGRPKGVLIRHDQLAHLVAWEGEAWQLGPWVRMAQTLSLGFDFGLQEVFTALSFGGCLVVPAGEERRDARRYARFLARERVTVLFTTPSYADQLVAAGEPLPALRLVLLGGEVLKRSTVLGLRRLVNAECRLVNGYGPTEATVNCLAYEVPADLDADADAVPVLPVGRPSGASRIRLVDEYGLPVPVGALGHIVIGGPGVADGYLHRPEATAERFVVDRRTGERVYRSGDLAHLDRDRGYVVVGRADRQVKVRGFRVEPEEVEHLARELSGVSACAVLVVPEPTRLVVFVVGTADAGDLLRHLADRLPAAMVPEQVTFVEHLPTTTNGKLDEALLQQVAQRERVAVLPDSASPRDVEATVCRIWADALAVSSLSPDDNVFDAGAHSLVATRVHRQLQTSLSLTFPIHFLFEYPRPRELASRLVVRRRSTPTSPPSQPAPTVKDKP